MPASPPVKDLVILVPDKDIQAALTGILNRHQSLNITPVQFSFSIDTGGRDPGCRRYAYEALRPFANRYRFALVVFDREGSSDEQTPREQIEVDVESQLSINGWGERCACICIAPEVENWLWSQSPQLCAPLGWLNSLDSLYDFVREMGYLPERSLKPTRPKEARQKVLRRTRTARSSAIFQSVAQNVSLRHCADPAFLKLKTVLYHWFSEV